MNPFEEGAQKVIPAVLVYAKSTRGVLMMHRSSNREDAHFGKWNGLGGKFERGESPAQAAVREFKEEAGVSVGPNQLQPLGTLYFPNFKSQKNEDWLVYVFSVYIDAWKVSGKGPGISEVKACPEGVLEWVPRERLSQLNLWEGDEKFLPYVLADQPFQGTFWYEEGRLTGFEMTRL